MIMDRVNGQRLSVLMAESASGKTSLLQAGVIPALREARLGELPTAGRSAPQFPFLLNQWLGRATGAGHTDFIRLMTWEADRYLGSCVAWYERKSSSDNETLAAAVRQDLTAIADARGALRSTAIRLGLGVLDDSTGELVPADGPSPDDDRTMVRNLLEVLSALTNTFGTILLILDQFEEVLGDPIISRQAIVAVEAIFDNCRHDVRQFLSLRNDSIHLLEPLERKSILEGKRRVSIRKLEADAVNSIVEQLSEVASLSWVDAADRERLIGTFTSQRPPRDVNLLGLQVVLAGLFTQLLERDTEEIAMDDLAAYCKSLGMSDGELALWLDPHPDRDNPSEIRHGDLAEVAPRKWIDRCLDTDMHEEPNAPRPQEASDVWTGQIKPMVMRMADWLVTPAGFKRPMTIGELEKIAFGADVSKNRRMTGAAKEWDRSRLETALRHTCEAALSRLVHGHVLKARGGASDRTYELVHDQFGRPLRQWAEAFSQTPAADLASPFEIADRPFQWSGPLRAALQDGRLQDVAWIGCTIRDVDFSDLTLLNCDLSRTLFENCTFNEATRLEGCALQGAILNRCTFTGSCLISCNLDSLLVFRGTRLDAVRIADGSMKSATLTDAILRDCTFVGSSDQASIPMRNMELLNCRLEGTITFERCALDGATIGDETEASRTGEIKFLDCDLRGAEIRYLRFEDGSLEIRGGVARGAVFERIVTAKNASGAPRAIFDSVVLTGAVFLGCTLRGVEFRGAARQSETKSLTNASTLVFRHWGGDDAPVPTILDDVSFRNLDLENFSFLRCRIDGTVAFQACGLSGGTIRGSESDGSVRVNGDIAFMDGCDLAALELNTLDMTGKMLKIIDSKAPGLYFERVTIAPETKNVRSAHFERTGMAGALFLGCSIQGAHFAGKDKERALMETLVVRGTDAMPASLSDCEFEHVNLENFTFENCVIAGPLTFSDSALSGGTLGNQAAGNARGEAMEINGSLTFTGCELNALEVTNVRFAEDARLIATRGECRGALFAGVDFAANALEAEPALLMDGVDLSGAVFLECNFGRASFLGYVGGSRLQRAWGLVFRGNRLNDVLFRNYDCDGATFEDLDIGERLLFEDCSLLRSKFSGIRPSVQGAALDLRKSDLLYAEVEQGLLDRILPTAADAPANDSALAILDGQLKASMLSAEGRKHLRLTDRKL